MIVVGEEENAARISGGESDGGPVVDGMVTTAGQDEDVRLEPVSRRPIDRWCRDLAGGEEREKGRGKVALVLESEAGSGYDAGATEWQNRRRESA